MSFLWVGKFFVTITQTGNLGGEAREEKLFFCNVISRYQIILNVFKKKDQLNKAGTV